MNKLVLIVITALVLGGGGYLLFANMQSTVAPTRSDTPMGTSPGMNSDESVEEQGQADTTQAYTLEEVAQRNTPDNCWMVIDGNVYDVTRFIASHPGGRVIVGGCGKDATDLFKNRDGRGESHSNRAFNMLPQYKIGSLQ